MASHSKFSSNVHPSLEVTNMDLFWINLLKLSTQIPMFPHPQDLLASGCKVQRDNDLMIVATSVTRTPYPRSITMTTWEELEKQSRNTGIVIKRDYSDSNNCTFLPPKTRKDNSRYQSLKEKFIETEESYQGIKKLPYPSWIGQPYMPGLIDKGEIRAFVVGGKLIHSTHTYPTPLHPWNSDVVVNYTPLDLLE